MRKNLIIGIVIGAILSTMGIVTAQTIIKSNEVTYDNSKSNGSFSNVQESLDELYQKAGYTGEEYHEDILNGAYPVLSGELIPVVIKGNGDVYYANTYTEWYSYKEKRWANAVILVDNAKTKYSVGQKIGEEDIESYFVWIPRYAYKLWNLDSQNGIIDAKTLTNDDYASSPSQLMENDRVIELVFGTKSYLDNLGYKSLTRDSGTGMFTQPEGLAIDNYLEHPAFTLGNTELNGFWMGKFETGYNQTNTGESAITGTENWIAGNALVTTGNSSKVVVKPNVYAWRNIDVSNIFNTAKGYKTELKSHMLKNTEWGAVAYLSHSAYGKGGEININNTSDYKTGYSANPNTDQTSYPGEYGLSTSGLSDKYNTPVGYLASTTGNITGVYDMSGGAIDKVAAALISDRTGDKSGFSEENITAEIKAGYIDVYPTEIWNTKYTNRILGDATGEMAPFYSYYEAHNEITWHGGWYGDFSDFINQESPWLGRGGADVDGIIAGIFGFYRRNGTGEPDYSFRLALAP